MRNRGKEISYCIDKFSPDAILLQTAGTVFLKVYAVMYFSFKSTYMLRWTVIFLIVAIIAAIFGFGGIAAGAAGIAKILFFIFIILFILSLIRGRSVE